MTEKEYVEFVRLQKRLARRDLESRLGDWCEELGWSRTKWVSLRTMARQQQLRTVLYRFNEVYQNFKKTFLDSQRQDRYKETN